MKKKTFVTMMLVLMLSITSFTTAYAQSSSFNLVSGMTSASTSRVSVSSSEQLGVNIFMRLTNKTPVTYTIFKSGVAYSSGSLSTSTRFLEKKFNVPAGDYSVRVYCNSKSSPRTSCEVNGNIQDY